MLHIWNETRTQEDIAELFAEILAGDPQWHWMAGCKSCQTPIPAGQAYGCEGDVYGPCCVADLRGVSAVVTLLPSRLHGPVAPTYSGRHRAV